MNINRWLVELVEEDQIHLVLYSIQCMNFSKQDVKIMMGKTSSIRSKFDINYKLVLK